MCADQIKRIAITGANGFVGRALLAACVEKNLGYIIAITRQRFESGLADVENIYPFNPQGTLNKVAVVIHVAARVHVMHDASVDPLAEFRAVNTQAPLEFAQTAARSGVKRFIYISTAKVNGESTLAGKPFTADDSPNPQDPYSVSKWEAEQGLSLIAQQTGMQVVVIRPPLIYGPGVKANFAALIRAVQCGIPLPLAAVRNARSLVGLDNLVDLIVTCIHHLNAANQTFLVSDGHDISTPQLLRTMAVAAGVADRQFAVPLGLIRTLGIITGKSTSLDRLCGNLQLDISKAQTMLSWVPPVSLEEGMRRAMRHRLD
jgi:nucleoside-diphosphate-sugar epimerase